MFFSFFVGILVIFSGPVAAETTRSTELCQIDPDIEKQYRADLQSMRNDCSPLQLPEESMPATAKVIQHYGLEKPEVVRLIQSVDSTLKRLTNQNAALHEKVAMCTKHRFTLHEARRELNRQYPPSCPGYSALIEESKELEKNIAAMIVAGEARVRSNFEIARRLQAIVELARKNPNATAKPRAPASFNEVK